MNKYLKYNFAAIAVLLVASFFTVFPSKPAICAPKAASKQMPSKFFKAAGHLNYLYSPGVFVPLRNGKILALSGLQYEYFGRTEPEHFFNAADGERYGFGNGMTELFDPETGQTQVLTKMPFTFYRDSSGNRRQMKAVELNDGRIFMVGRFEENRPVSPRSSHIKSQPNMKLWQRLPIYSKLNPKNQLVSIAPPTEPNMFGLIYNWHNHTFEIVHSPESIPPRWMVTLHLLPDGKVLIVGGAISLGATGMVRDLSFKEFPETRVLLFDPKTNKINAIGNLRHPRYGHEAIQLSKSEFELFGGFGLSDTETKEKYSPIVTKDRPYPISPHYSRTFEVEVFDLKKANSRIAGHTLTGRYDFSVIPLPNKTVFINGGAVSNLLGYYASELYNMKTGTTTYVGNKRPPVNQNYKTPEDLVPYYLFGEGLWFRSALKGDVVVIIGNQYAFVYNWQNLANEKAPEKKYYRDYLISPRYDDHHVVQTATGRIFVMGGQTFKALSGSSVTGKRPADLIEEFIYPTQDSAKGK